MKSIAITVTFLCSAATFSQIGSGQADDIVQRLMSGRFPLSVVRLDPAQKTLAVKDLQLARDQATGARSLEIAFLLAELGADYAKNRDLLVTTMRDCSSRSRRTDCEDTADLLMGLYAHGHHELLGSLLVAGTNSDGALSEILGPFYGDVLIKAPSDFLSGLRHLAAPARKSVCFLAGASDGGGLSPEKLAQAGKRLRAAGDDVALRCLQEIEGANRQ